jgi:TPR repeat protein
MAAAPVRSATLTCKAGGKVDIEWKGKWYPGTMRAGPDTDGRCPIAYDGYDASWNESVPMARLRAPTPPPAPIVLTDAQKAQQAEAKKLMAEAGAAKGVEAARLYEKTSRMLGRLPGHEEIAATAAFMSAVNYQLEGTSRMLEDQNPHRLRLLSARMFKRAAGPGAGGAATIYAYFLRTGFGVAKDEPAARRVLKPFAEAGNADAMAQYGQMLLAGIGGPQDIAAARTFLQKSAEMEDKNGLLYWGDVVRRDKGDAAALPLYRRAAEKDNAKAMVKLGRLLLWSKEVPRDPEAGKTWLHKASDELEWDAAYELARIYTRDPDPAVRAKGAALAQRGALSMNADHAIFYAGLLKRGVGVEKNLAGARTYLENAMLNGNREQKKRAQLELAALR